MIYGVVGLPADWDCFARVVVVVLTGLVVLAWLTLTFDSPTPSMSDMPGCLVQGKNWLPTEDLTLLHRPAQFSSAPRSFSLKWELSSSVKDTLTVGYRSSSNTKNWKNVVVGR